MNEGDDDEGETSELRSDESVILFTFHVYVLCSVSISLSLSLLSYCSHTNNNDIDNY